MNLRIVPVSFTQATEFVTMHHRHHPAPRGMKFAVGLASDEELVGVAIIGRPVARHYDNGLTLEVNRTCIAGEVPNGNSMLYGAAWRAAKALGYRRLITYTQDGESGSSLRGAGWRAVAELQPRDGWDAPSRRRVGNGNDGVARTLWEATATDAGQLSKPRVDLDRLKSALAQSWSADTSASPDEWTPENRALGQCAVTALVVQDFYGGSLLRTMVGDVSHYWNQIPSGIQVDLTRSQFADFTHGEVSTRERDYVLSFPETQRRYGVLRARVEERMS